MLCSTLGTKTVQYTVGFLISEIQGTRKKILGFKKIGFKEMNVPKFKNFIKTEFVESGIQCSMIYSFTFDQVNIKNCSCTNIYHAAEIQNSHVSDGNEKVSNGKIAGIVLRLFLIAQDCHYAVVDKHG